MALSGNVRFSFLFSTPGNTQGIIIVLLYFLSQWVQDTDCQAIYRHHLIYPHRTQDVYFNISIFIKVEAGDSRKFRSLHQLRYRRPISQIYLYTPAVSLVHCLLLYPASQLNLYNQGWHVQNGSVRFSSVTQSCPTLCDPMNHSTPGLPVHHHLPEFTQTHVHRVSDAIQPSQPLSSPSPPAPNPSQHQSLFQGVNSSHEVAKVLEFQL